MMLYLKLFWEFFKTGLFAVGGGMATIPFLEDMADATNWFTRTDLANMIAVGESTPGPIGVNMATYVGFVTGMNDGGVLFALLGAVIATLGLITPSIIVILIIAAMLKSFRDNKYVERAFYGLRPASTGLIAAAGISVLIANLFVDEVTSIDIIGGADGPTAIFVTSQMTSDFLGSIAAAVNWKGLILGIILWILTNVVKKTKKLHPIVFIGIAAVVGVVFSM